MSEKLTGAVAFEGAEARGSHCSWPAQERTPPRLLMASMVLRSIRVQSSPLRIGVQRVSRVSKARISAGVSGVSPAAKTASGNLAADAGARQHRGVLCGEKQEMGDRTKGQVTRRQDPGCGW